MWVFFKWAIYIKYSNNLIKYKCHFVMIAITFETIWNKLYLYTNIYHLTG